LCNFRWIKTEGTTHLGVASPGVILDLLTLTRTLRARYIETQTSVYPVVELIRAFGVTHTFYLDQVRGDCDKWMNSDSEADRKLALKNADAFVQHSKTWGNIVARSVGNVKDTVNIMTAQLHDVRLQLETQLTLLQDRLVGLKATLQTQKETLDKLNAAFWGCVAAIFVGQWEHSDAYSSD
jgi:hypothetical protein